MHEAVPPVPPRLQEDGSAPASLHGVQRPLQQGGLLSAIQSLLYFTIAGLFLTTFVAQPIRIPSASMQPTLLVGDFLLLDKRLAGEGGHLLPPADVRSGDIIVFHEPTGDPAIHLVKRVVGVPGDRIHLHEGIVYRNGERLDERYAVRTPAMADPYRDDFPSLGMADVRVDPAWWIALRRLARTGEVTVPPASYFVLGDNRNDSEDSRYWGFVPQSAIVGRPVVVYFSYREPAATGDGARRGFDFARWRRSFHVVR